MNFLSLFSGIGGFDLAFTRVGLECVGMCEIEPKARAVLARHFPNIPIHEDVKELGVNQYAKGTVDLICGGFPCQDLSVAGKRAGLAGERSGLWFEFARIIDELEPKWVVIENVPGLLSSNKGQDFAVILRWLEERGYGVCWRVLDAQHFGVPQRRRRVFIVGHLGDGRAAEVLFERESMSRDTKKGRKAGKEIAYSLRSNPSHSGDKGDGGVNTTLIGVATLGHSQSHGLGVGYQDKANTLEGTSSVNQAIIGTLPASGAGLDRPAGQGNELDFLVPSLVSNGDSHSGFRDGDGSGKAKTITTREAASLDSETMNFIVSEGVRRLTPMECERLQGFPDGWTNGQADSIRYHQLGNAVAVPVVEWIGRRIYEVR